MSRLVLERCVVAFRRRYDREYKRGKFIIGLALPQPLSAVVAMRGSVLSALPFLLHSIRYSATLKYENGAGYIHGRVDSAWWQDGLTCRAGERAIRLVCLFAQNKNLLVSPPNPLSA